MFLDETISPSVNEKNAANKCFWMTRVRTFFCFHQHQYSGDQDVTNIGKTVFIVLHRRLGTIFQFWGARERQVYGRSLLYYTVDSAVHSGLHTASGQRSALLTHWLRYWQPWLVASGFCFAGRTAPTIVQCCIVCSSCRTTVSTPRTVLCEQ